MGVEEVDDQLVSDRHIRFAVHLTMLLYNLGIFASYDEYFQFGEKSWVDHFLNKVERKGK